MRPTPTTSVLDVRLTQSTRTSRLCCLWEIRSARRCGRLGAPECQLGASTCASRAPRRSCSSWRSARELASRSHARHWRVGRCATQRAKEKGCWLQVLDFNPESLAPDDFCSTWEAEVLESQLRLVFGNCVCRCRWSCGSDANAQLVMPVYSTRVVPLLVSGDGSAPVPKDPCGGS